MGSPGPIFLVVIAVFAVAVGVAWVLVRARKAKELQAITALDEAGPIEARLPKALQGRPATPMPTAPPTTDAPLAPGSTPGPLGPPPGAPPTMAPPLAPLGSPPATVAELLAGISLPCGLAPTFSFVRHPEAIDEVVFVTDEVPVDIVRLELVAALEAIGIAVTPIGADQADLARGAVRGVLSTPTVPSQERRGNADAYAALPPAGVIADIWTIG